MYKQVHSIKPKLNAVFVLFNNNTYIDKYSGAEVNKFKI